MARTELDYITLADFTPGIYSKWGAVGQLGKDGAAMATDGTGRYTYGCYGDPDGGLRPLPRKIKTFSTDFTETIFNGGDGDSVNPITDTKAAIIDFVVLSNLRYGLSTTATDDAWSTENMEESFPEAADTHPDALYVLTSHRTTAANVNAITGHAPHLTSFSADGALVCQMKVWSVSRMADGSTNLTSVERALQQRVATSEFGDAGTLYDPLGDSEFFAMVDPRATVDTDAIPAGTLAIGRSVPQIGPANPITGDSYTLEDLDDPGLIVVVGCVMLGRGFCTKADGYVGFPNIFSIHGAYNMVGLTFAGTGGTVPQKGNLSVPNDTVKWSAWTAWNVPNYLIEHQDRFLGVINDYTFGNIAAAYDLHDPDGSGGTYNSNNFVESSGYFRYSELNAAVVYDIQDTAPGSNTRMNFWKKEEAGISYELGTPEPDIFGNWTPGEVGCLISMNNDLLVVRHNGGASLVRGALEDPTVIRFTSAHSSGGVRCIPAYTSIGALYGTVHGIVLWNGGNETQIVSNQLDGWFWDTGADNEVSHDNSNKRKNGLAGRFDFSYPFAYVSGDWVMDVRTGAWFRLIDPATDTNPYKHMFYSVSDTGKVYAARGCYDATNLDVVDLFDPQQRAVKYQWVSQPIYRSINKDMDVQEVVLVAQGTGTVTVTLVGIDGQEQEHVFAVNDDDRPTRMVANMGLVASDLTVIVESEGQGTGTTQSSAPVVHAIHLGVPTEKMRAIPRET